MSFRTSNSAAGGTASRDRISKRRPTGGDAGWRTGTGKNRRPTQAFAAHLRHVGRVYPAAKHPRVVLLIDNAPWHGGQAVEAALAENPHLECKRLPPYSPQLAPIERVWKLARRLATHNHYFATLAQLVAAVVHCFHRWRKPNRVLHRLCCNI